MSVTVVGRLILASLGLGSVVALVAHFPLNPDVAWFMNAAHQILDGARLYEDLLEVNPSLAFYLLMPAVVVAEQFGMADVTALTCWIGVLALCSSAWFLSVLKVRITRGGRWLWWVGLLAFALLIVPAFDFGQREHMLVLLTLPFLAVKSRRIRKLHVGSASSWAAGVFAGLGFALKPHFVLIWGGLELLDQLKRRGDAPVVRPETVAVALVMVAYVLFTIAENPAYLPMMVDLAPLYRDFSSEPGRRWFVVFFALPTVVVAVAARLSRSRDLYRGVIVLLLVFGGLGFVAALLQGKGWRYQSLHLIIATVLAWGILIEHSVRASFGRTSDGDRARGVVATAILMIAAYPFALGFSYVLKVAWEERAALETRAIEIKRYAPESLLVFGDVVSDAFPVTNMVGARSVSPTSSMWWLRALYGNGSALRVPASVGARSNVERKLADALVERFARDRPDVVLVDTLRHRRFGGEAFPYVSYFSRDPTFARAWESYERVGAVGRFEVWRNTRP